MRISMGQINLVATAGPTEPPNVMTASSATFQQPYWNEIIRISQNPLGNPSAASNILPTSGIPAAVMAAVAQYNAAPASTQQTTLQQYQALYSYLPTLLTNAAILDAWLTAQGPPYSQTANNTAMGQYTQTFLTQFLEAIGQAAPSQPGSDSSTSALPSWAIPAAIGAGLLILILVMER